MSSAVRQHITIPPGSFGFDPQESTHHFVVTIPRGAAGKIEISEHFSWDAERNNHDDGRACSGCAVHRRPAWQVTAVVLTPDLWRRIVEALEDTNDRELVRSLRDKLASGPVASGALHWQDVADDWT